MDLGCHGNRFCKLDPFTENIAHHQGTSQHNRPCHVLNVIGESTKPILVNNDLKPFYKLLPRKKKFFIKSVAIAPIIVNSEIIGSINLGDHSNLRYQPGMDTGLLEKLVSNVSDCLSNFMTCEKEASKQ